VSEKTLILVIGCHRSGTSAIAGCLSAMGVNFGDHLIGPAFDNPMGFFEDRRVVALHDHLLSMGGGSWDRVDCLDWDAMTKARPAVETELREIVRGLDGAVCGIKDPRATLFVPMWADLCADEGVSLSVLDVRRDHDAVIASLMKREGWTHSKATSVVAAYKHAGNPGMPCFSYLREDVIPEIWCCYFPQVLIDRSEFAKMLGWFGIQQKDAESRLANAFDPTLIHHGEHATDAPPWTVIIPSRDDAKVIDCVASLIERNPEIAPDQIVVVSDGLSEETRAELQDVIWVEGKSPFVFARAINMGAEAAHPDSDIVILGDDVRFATHDALDMLSRFSIGAAAIVPEIAGVCGQPAQRIGASDTSADWLAFVCAYIPRKVWDAVGPLDERFVGYGYDDVDWCMRAKDHGELRIAHNVTAMHIRDSSYRKKADWQIKYRENHTIFENKWKEALAQA
jgi:hypothetical protein